MNGNELIGKIVKKKEFSHLPFEDIKKAFEHFKKRQISNEEKVKLTRNLLRKIYSAFTSKKILSLKSLKNRDEKWILKKHLSTRERLPYYEEIYKRILFDLNRELTVIDLGAGINGLSYIFFKKIGKDVNYIAIEAIGQFVDLMNLYFKKEKVNAKAFHLSLFEINKVKKIISKTKKPRVIFLFKTIDSLEALEKNFSKKFLLEISSLAEKVVVSFAVESMIKRRKFKVKRYWILNFIEKNFKILDDFEFGGEKYIVFRKK